MSSPADPRARVDRATSPLFWLERVVQDVPAGHAWLSPLEREIVAEFAVAKRRDDWRLGRWTAKQALIACGWLSPRPTRAREIEIRAAGDGAPEALLAGRPADAAISLSHADRRAACVVARRGTAIGCDIETIASRSSRFIADFFTESERSTIDAASDGERALLATLIWSAKESGLKALRDGLRVDTRTVEVTLSRGASVSGWTPLIVTAARSGRTFRGFWSADSRRVATVVSDPPCAAPPSIS